MPISWSAQMDQKLLIAVISAVKLDADVLLKKWTELFDKDDVECPTKRAIVEHVSRLKKSMGITGAKSDTVGKTITTTPRSSKKKVKAGAKSVESGNGDLQKKSGISIEEDSSSRPPKKRSALSSKASPLRTKSQGKSRSRSVVSSRSSHTMTDESEDDAVLELIDIKNEDDDYGGPVAMPAGSGTPSPSRSQQPRTAKSNRSPVIMDDEEEEEQERDDIGPVELVQSNGIPVGLLTPPPPPLSTGAYSPVSTTASTHIDQDQVSDPEKDSLEPRVDSPFVEVVPDTLHTSQDTHSVEADAQSEPEVVMTDAVEHPDDEPLPRYKAEKEYRLRSIVAEDVKKKRYLIDWESDSDTGEHFELSWEPMSHANQLAIDDWEAKKAADRKASKRPQKSLESPHASKKLKRAEGASKAVRKIDQRPPLAALEHWPVAQ